MTIQPGSVIGSRVMRPTLEKALNKLSNDCPRCANPRCGVGFNFRTGRLFGLDSGYDTSFHRLEYFWLCHSCSQLFDIELRAGTFVLVGRS